MSKLEVSAYITIRSGKLAGFKQQVAEIVRLTKEKDTGTLRYDWFINSDLTECEIRQAYTSSEVGWSTGSTLVKRWASCSATSPTGMQ